MHDLEYSVTEAQSALKKILDKERNPQFANVVSHKYEDKYALANWLTTSAVSAVFSTFELLGINQEILKELKKNSDVERSSVFLSLDRHETCEFVKEEVKKVESDSEMVYEKTSHFGTKSKSTTKVVTKIHEYYWQFTADWKIIIYTGDVKHEIMSRKIEQEIVVVGNEESPKPKSKPYPPTLLQLNWFFDLISFLPGESQATVTFEINRNSDADCRTPRRNKDINQALGAFMNVTSWCTHVFEYFDDILTEENALRQHHMMSTIGLSELFSSSQPFIPVFTLMEEVGEYHQEENNGSPARVVGSVKADFSKIIELHKIELLDLLEKAISTTKPSEDAEKSKKSKSKIVIEMITEPEARVLTITRNILKLCYTFNGSIDYIENMLIEQLVNAIGKKVEKKDFDEYMRYHHTKIFKENFVPKPFCYAIRRENHYPEGTLTIEPTQAGSQPVATTVKKCPNENGPSFNFPLNAATTVCLNGPRYVHASVQHSFSGEKLSLQIAARARQFSSFILMIGTLSGANSFDPKHSIIIKNKDDLKLPLILETIPTAQEFKDAIESLSPEQQRFAKQFRAMQLASTLFAMVVIQIKPQLEKLLNLPNDSLTKEIALTENLMDLFIEYQIPSDLISYDSSFVLDDDESKGGKIELAQVKHHVSNMDQMIEKMKNDTVSDKAKETALRMMEEECAMSMNLACAGLMDDGPPIMHMAKSKKKKGGGGFPTLSMAAPKAGRGRRSANRSKQDYGGAAPECFVLPTNTISDEAKSVSPEEHHDDRHDLEVNIEEHSGNKVGDDLTLLPSILEAKYDQLEESDAKLRPTILKIGESWSKEEQKTLLSKVQSLTLDADAQKRERTKALDLIDALSKSGAISIDCAELHIVIAATHCFTETVMDCIIRGNKNPIERIEKSMLLISSVVHDKSIEDIANEQELTRINSLLEEPLK